MFVGSRVVGTPNSVDLADEGLAPGSSSKMDEGARSPRTREFPAEGLLLRYSAVRGSVEVGEVETFSLFLRRKSKSVRRDCRV